MKRALLSTIAVLSFATTTFASVTVFTGSGSEKVLIENASTDTAYVKIEGVKSPWAGKVIKTTRENKPTGDRYSFDYELELSDGKHPRTYNMVVGNGQTLVKGTVVKKATLFVSGGPSEGYALKENEDLSQKSQNLGLEAAYKKAPFKPTVE